MGIWYFLVDSVANWDNLFCLIYIAIIFVAGNEIELSSYYPVIVLLVNIIIEAAINMNADYKVKLACMEIN
jgi:hypothetical protein